MAIIEKMTVEEKEQLKKLCYDYKVYQTTESEAKKEKEKTSKAIKELLDKYNYNTSESLDVYTIDYKEQNPRIADTDKMKMDGIYDKYSKIQHKKPLTIR